MTSRFSSTLSVKNELKSLIVVSCATSALGHSVVKAFSENDQYNIRALTRNIKSDRAIQLQKQFKDIELFQCDANNFDQVREAFDGAYAVFANTSYWGHNESEFGEQNEVQQGKNMMDAAVEKNVEHCIWVSQPNANSLSYNKLHTATSNKNIVERYARGKYSMSNTSFTYLYPGFALSNIVDFFKCRVVDNVLQNDPLPINEDTKVAYLDIEDFGIIVKYILDNPKQYRNEDFMASSGNISIPELLQLVAKKADLQYKFNHVTYEQYQKITNNSELVDLFHFWNEYGHLYQDVGVARKFIPSLKSAEEWIASYGIDWIKKQL